MRRIREIGTFMAVMSVCILGCNSSSSDDDTYDDMTSKYTTYTVAGLWTALSNGDDVSGTYILLKDEVYQINSQVVTLMDSSTSKVVECTFEDGIDLSGLASGDTVTIGGVCRFVTDSSSYPELDSCDYVYINSAD